MNAIYRHLIFGLLLLPLAALLGGCAVSDHFFHPHRLGNPPLTASNRKKARERYKELHKPTTLGPAEESIKGDKGSADTGTADAAPVADGTAATDDKKQTYGDLSQNIRNTYNRELLLKKGFMQRSENRSRQLHHYAKARPAHTDANEAARHHRHYVRNRKPAPDPEATASAPAANRPKNPIRAAAAHRAPVVAAKVKPKREPAPPAAAAPAAKPTNGIGKKLVRPAVAKAAPAKPLNGDGKLVRRVVVKPAPAKPTNGALIPPTHRVVVRPTPVKPNTGALIPPTHRTVSKPVAVKPTQGAYMPPTHRTVARPVAVKPTAGAVIPPTHRTVTRPVPVKPAEGMYIPPTHRILPPRPASVKPASESGN